MLSDVDFFFELLPDAKVISEYKSERGADQLEINAQACKLFENVERVFEENILVQNIEKRMCK